MRGTPLNIPPQRITTMRSIVRTKPYSWHDGDAVIPGASLRLSKANLFVPYEQMREVADMLHDICDAYDEAEAEGRLLEVVT